MNVLVTAGATREFFDPVRYISNPSSGKMGCAIAAAARERGCAVTLVAANLAVEPPEGVKIVPVTTGDEMLRAVKKAFPHCDILFKAAAVCDFRPKHYEAQKHKKDGRGMTVEFVPVPDILKTVAARKSALQTVVGFAAETHDVEVYAQKKLFEKNLDFVAANVVGRASGAFGSDENTLILLGRDGSRRVLGPDSKKQIGRELVAQILRAHKAKIRPPHV